MSKKQVLCLLGVWVMIFPFLGFPSFWIRIIALVSGLIIVGLAYTLPSQVSTGKVETFVENKQQ